MLKRPPVDNIAMSYKRPDPVKPGLPVKRLSRDLQVRVVVVSCNKSDRHALIPCHVLKY